MSNDSMGKGFLAGLVETIADLGRRAGLADRQPLIEANGRTFVVDDTGDYCEVERLIHDDDEHLEPIAVLDIASVIAWAKAFDLNGGPGEGEVRLSRAGVTGAVYPRHLADCFSRERVTKPFYDEHIPKAAMGYSAFRTWLDQLGDGLDDREALDASLSSVSASEGSELTVMRHGAFTSVTAGSKKAPTAAGQIPRRIKALIPFGDPAFVTPVTFLLSVTVGAGGLVFAVEHLRSDGALDAWLEWARDELAKGLPDGWHVFVTP